MLKKYKGRTLLDVVEESGKKWYSVTELAIVLDRDRVKLRNIFNKNAYKAKTQVDYIELNGINYYEINSVKAFMKAYYPKRGV